MKHPIFGTLLEKTDIIDENAKDIYYFVLRVLRLPTFDDEETPQLGFRIVKNKIDSENEDRHTLVTAEYIALDMIEREVEISDTFDAVHSTAHDLLIKINQRITKIASRSRRAMGNVIIVSPAIYDYMFNLKVSDGTPLITEDLNPQNVVTALTLGGIFHGRGNGIPIYIAEHWNRNHPIMIAYKGVSNMDGGLFLIEDGGRYIVKEPYHYDEAFPWQTYYQRLGVKND